MALGTHAGPEQCRLHPHINLDKSGARAWKLRAQIKSLEYRDYPPFNEPIGLSLLPPWAGYPYRQSSLHPLFTVINPPAPHFFHKSEALRSPLTATSIRQLSFPDRCSVPDIRVSVDAQRIRRITILHSAFL